MTDLPAGRQGTDGDVEVEWQFDALDLRPVERWLAALPLPGSSVGGGTVATAMAKPARRLVDRYLDTEDWRIGRAGLVLRTRSRGRTDEATLKDTRPAGAGGLRQRLEVTEPLPEGGVEAIGAGGPVGRRIRAVAGPRSFRQILEVRTRRRPYALRVGDDEVAEIALDDTVITLGTGQQPLRLRRVEVEVLPLWVDTLGPFVDDLRAACGLQPATLSKFEAGLLALGVEVPGVPDLGPTDVRSTSNLGDVAFAVIRAQLHVLLAREPGTRLGEDIEELHDMRVATRRLRAAFDFFVDALPVRAQALRSELGWLADVLGQVRDLDVQLDRMDEMQEWVGTDDATVTPPLGELRGLLEAQREAARVDLLDALDSTRWERLVSGLVALAQFGQRRRTAAAREPAVVALPDLVLSRHRAVTRATRRARRTREAADFHRLRIRCKRLRYSLEFASGVYGGRTDRLTRKLAKLQDALGSMQDAEVATARLLALATSPSPVRPEGLPPRTIFAMGAIAEHYRVESGSMLSRMPKRLALLKGPEWRDLAAHMSKRRQEILGEVRPVETRRPASPVDETGPDVADDAEPVATEPPTDGPVLAIRPYTEDQDRPHQRLVEAAELTAKAPGEEPWPGPVEPVTRRVALGSALSAWPEIAWNPPTRASAGGSGVRDSADVDPQATGGGNGHSPGAPDSRTT